MLKLQEKRKTVENRKQRRSARAKAKAGRTPLTISAAGMPPHIASLLKRAGAHQKAGRLGKAEGDYRQVVSEKPDCAAAHFGLAVLLSQKKGPFDGYPHFKRALELDPENGACWGAFGKCLTGMGQHQAAVIAYENAVKRKPNDPVLLLHAGWARYNNDEFTEALALYERALSLKPGFLPALLGKGQQHLSVGDSAAARRCFEEVMEIDPDSAEALYRLISMSEKDDLEPMIGRAKESLARLGKEQEATRLHFAIARGYQRLGDTDAAFSWFASGNAAIRKTAGFDRDQTREEIDAMVEAFRPEVFETLAEAGCDTQLPVFIVGMPRSGSTLLEQIIASHPDVADAGEFPKLFSTLQLLTSNRSGKLHYPRDIARFETAPLAALGADYMDALKLGRPSGAKRITDKLLANFLHLGLIHIMFPKATIFHCRRDPMATGLSCFTQMFGAVKHLPYAFDLSDLGFYYRQYERLMDHWRAVLPPGRIFEVVYEEMVAAQETMSRKVIEHIGLPWDDACLEFYKMERSVRTASIQQVRKPVYNSSVEGWRKYEKHLEPLREALAAGA